MAESSVIGHLDGLEGSSIVGWAIEPGSSQCVISVENEAGTIIATGKASLQRPDLHVLGKGVLNFGFKIAVDITKARDFILVKANGMPIANNRIKLGRNHFDGNISLLGYKLTGWIRERVKVAGPVKFEVVNTRNQVVLSEMLLPDDAAADAQFQPFYISLPLPITCYEAKQNMIHIRLNGRRFTTFELKGGLEGHLDVVDENRCSGWLLSAATDHRNLAIEAVADGKVIAEGICDFERHDLKEFFPHNWACGFELSFDRSFRPSEDFVEFHVRLQGSDRPLFDGTCLVAPRRTHVKIAQRISRVARGGDLSLAERSVLRAALQTHIDNVRHGPNIRMLESIDKLPQIQRNSEKDKNHNRLNIVIPVYKGIEITRKCIESVIAHRKTAVDRILVIADAPPEQGMLPMLMEFTGHDNYELILNKENLGFVNSVNKALALCDSGHAILLNSDTQLFEGGLDELVAIGEAREDIGTVTALSNNATIFSYPAPDLPMEALDDMAWNQVASACLVANRGRWVEVPTGHGFCMLIKRSLLDQQPALDTRFGQGYGEENAYCLKAQDLGYRNVAALAAFVQHKESVSFGHDKRVVLIAENMPKLLALYPEYTANVMTYQETDDLRVGRWALDFARLKEAARTREFVATIQHKLGGGTTKAINDIERHVGYGNRTPIIIGCDKGLITLECAEPKISAKFLGNEVEELIKLLEAARVEYVLIHQMLGFDYEAMQDLTKYLKQKKTIYFLHDFYPICPRVTLIDAIGNFCGVRDTKSCERCVKLGGAHESSYLTEITPEKHRRLFETLLATAQKVVVPSEDTKAYYQRALPALKIEAVPHYDPDLKLQPNVAAKARQKSSIVLLGAIGEHKGSAKLLELVRAAYMTDPDLHFHVMGYTNIDRQLLEYNNITIHGRYKSGELPDRLKKIGAQIALFLHGWPETYSYTLNEAVSLGLIPIVPDIGAPAERVRKANFGHVFPFPFGSEDVLKTIRAASADGKPSGTGRGAARGFSELRSSGEYARQIGFDALLREAPAGFSGSGAETLQLSREKPMKVDV